MGGKNDNPNDYFMDSRLRVPDKRSGWVKFKEAIYNPETGEVLGRSKKLWGMTGIFYLIFYTALAILCALCGMGLMATIDEHEPKYILEESLIGTNPGLGFRPSPDIDAGSLIWYNTANTTEITGWISRINKFLEKYIDSRSLPQGGRNQEVCDYGKLPKEGNVCSVFINNLGICSPAQNYGYHNSAPCVFIKLNKIYGWIPEYYNDTNNLPSDMPEDLVEHIQAVAKSSPEKLNTVWVSCTGENPHDKENIGLVEYYPIRGFPSYYFPYKNVPGYLSPIVAVNFKRPAKNIIINIECRAWAKNIKYNKSIRERTGMVHFEIQVDNKPPEEKS